MGHFFKYCICISIILFFYLVLSSICIRRKYWIRDYFRIPVFDGFTCFEMSLTQLNHFKKMSVFLSVCLSVCTSSKFCGNCIFRTKEGNLMKFYIQLHLYIMWILLDFGVYCSRSSDVVQYF